MVIYTEEMKSKELQAAQPLLSVVIPSLCSDLELRRCVDSVRLAFSDDPRVEIIIVMPRAAVIAHDSFDNGGVRVRVVSERRKGIYSAMNDGIRASNAKYMYFLGKDDIVLPAFGQIISVLESASPSAVFCDVYWGASGVFSGRPSKWRVLIRNICHQGIVYSAEVIDEHGPYLRKMKVQADHLLNIKMLWDSLYSGRISYIPGARVWYSGDGYSATTRDAVFWRLYPLVLKKYVGRFAAAALIASRKLRFR